MSIRFGSKPSFYRKVATVCNEGMPKNDRKEFDFKPNGGGNRLRASCVHNVTGGNEILAEGGGHFYEQKTMHFALRFYMQKTMHFPLRFYAVRMMEMPHFRHHT